MRPSSRLSILAALAFSCATAGASATVINFDDQVVPPGVTTVAGNLYAASGITFTTGNMSPDLSGPIAVGDVFTLIDIDPNFSIINNANAVSAPNFAGAAGLGNTRDTLMSFSSPVSTLSLHTDDTPESPELVRLLALRATGNLNEYEVLAISSKFDDATTEPDNLLGVSLASQFSFAIFQVTTEQEGFDDVTFVPEPASALLVALGVAGVAGLRRRRVGAVTS